MVDHSKPSGYDAKSPGGINSRLIILVGAISTVLLVVILIAVESWFYNQERKLTEEGYRRGNPELHRLLDAQEQRLSRLQRIEGDADHVAVPLDWAIERFVAENQKEAAK